MLAVKESVALAPLTTFRIGGEARYFVEVKTEDQLREAVAWAKEKNVRSVILAGGSNVLVPDEGIDGLVIRVALIDHSFAGNELAADAGCNLLGLIRESAERNWGGWEKLAGIPGTIGGAARGNAGAFGSEIRDIITKVRAFDTETGEMREFENIVCDFSYRHSFFKDNPEWVITRAIIELKPSQYDISYALIEETIKEREKRHLQNVKAAGSFFMNPVAPQAIVDMFEKEKGLTSRSGRVPAGWLIEKAGMKGASEGDAQASLQHPNYIVNNGRASAEDVLALAQKIKNAVSKKFHVQLEEEAVIL